MASDCTAGLSGHTVCSWQQEGLKAVGMAFPGRAACGLILTADLEKPLFPVKLWPLAWKEPHLGHGPDQASPAALCGLALPSVKWGDSSLLLHGSGLIGCCSGESTQVTNVTAGAEAESLRARSRPELGPHSAFLGSCVLKHL